MSESMRSTIKITLALVLAYFLIGAIESRTQVFSQLFLFFNPSAENDSRLLKDLELEMQLIQRNRDKFLAANLEGNRKQAKLTKELDVLKGRIVNLEGEIIELESNAENLETLVAEASKQPEVFHPMFEPVSNQLASQDILSVSSGRIDISRLCKAESRKLLNSWLRFRQLYSVLNLAELAKDRQSMESQSLANLELIKTIPDEQYVWIDPLVKSLLKYHAKLTAQTGWESRLKSINAMPDKSRLIDYIYQAGYPQSSDPCLTAGYTVNVGSYRSGYTTSVYLERWLYTFWLRRLSEGRMDEILLWLKLINLVIESTDPVSGHDFVFFKPMRPLEKQPGENRELLNQYSQLIVSRNIDDKIVFWVGERAESPAQNKLFAFSGLEHGQVVKYLETKSIQLQDQVELVYGQAFEKPGPDRPAISFYSYSKLDLPKNIFRKIETSTETRGAINKLLKNRFGSPWVFENTHNGKLSCGTQPRNRIASFTSQGRQVYIVYVDCSEWTGEGSSGPYATFVITRDSSSELIIRHQYIGIYGSIRIRTDWINDLDDDGKIEVLMEQSGGVSGSLDLVELDRNSWHLLRSIENWEEGGYQQFTDMDANIGLLYSRGLN